jgi:hypothetical protein
MLCVEPWQVYALVFIAGVGASLFVAALSILARKQ